MLTEKKKLSNFAHNSTVESVCVRPETEQQLDILSQHSKKEGILIRGHGLSYNDSCLSSTGLTILSERFNHFISFDKNSGIVICQPAVRIKELFELDPNWFPAIVPGTVNASVGGAIAHDVHGKNQYHAGNFSEQVLWIDLLIQNKTYRISPTEYTDLWRATIGGIGLTGIIKRVALQLKQQSRTVKVKRQRFDTHQALLQCMQTEGVEQAYQVAWLNILDGEQSILTFANHVPAIEPPAEKDYCFSIPKLPFTLLGKTPIKLFNSFYYRWTKESSSTIDFVTFNNPLDRIKSWQNLYGRKGLRQFQCVFPSDSAKQTLNQIQTILKRHKVIPCLSILKYFKYSGKGYLSFTQPGFTLAIDFINNKQSINAIEDLNTLILKIQGKIYMAKDFSLTKEPFQLMYPEAERFIAVLQTYQSPMRSNLGKRLGLHP